MRHAENELLTRIEGNAPMGKMLRQRYWMPYLRSARLEADGAPVKVRLLGENYVSFRATDGRIGFFDEGCPHRGASLTLARNEDNALRCIFHGWKMDVSGVVTETPSESRNPEKFAASVPLKHYPVREAGGLLWVWLGAQGASDDIPKFPDFEFTSLPEDHLFTSYTAIECNWLQGVEATLDSSHVGLLHQSWIAHIAGDSNLMASNLAPRYEFQSRPYGLRAAALRPLDDGRVYARVGEFVSPFYMFVGTSNSAAGERTLFISVPVDDGHSILFFVRYSLADKGPLTTGPGVKMKPQDPDNFAPLPGPASQTWGQDRELMKKGHFTGFDGNILIEDIVVQVSMGPIADRTKEYLCSSDRAIVEMRRLMLKAVRDHQAGTDSSASDRLIAYHSISANARIIPANERWEDHFSD